MKRLRVAIVYDKAVTWGGAERLLEAVNRAFPQAPLYTLVADKSLPWVKRFPRVYASWAQNIGWLVKNPQFLAPWSGGLFSRFDLSNYDVVISVTSYNAKAVVTGDKTLHLCYCLTPNRYLWVKPGYGEFGGFGVLGTLIHFVKQYWLPKLRIADQMEAQNPDKYLTLSSLVQKRIKKYYQRESEIIYPGVDTEKFKPSEKKQERKYFLTVARLTGYKQMTLLIKTFSSLPYQLLIVGEGPDKNKLESLIKTDNVKLLGYVDEKKLVSLYQKAIALIMPQEEDFGLVALEALACGTPVILNSKSGVGELIEYGVHGLKIDKISQVKIKEAVELSIRGKWDQRKLIKLTKQYDWSQFVKKMKETVNKEWNDFSAGQTK